MQPVQPPAPKDDKKILANADLADPYAFITETIPQESTPHKVPLLPKTKLVILVAVGASVFFIVAMVILTIMMHKTTVTPLKATASTSQNSSGTTAANKANTNLDSYTASDINGDGAIDDQDTNAVSAEDVSWWQSLLQKVGSSSEQTASSDSQTANDSSTYLSYDGTPYSEDSSTYSDDESANDPSADEYDPTQTVADPIVGNTSPKEPTGGSAITIASWNTLYSNASSNVKKGAQAVASKADIIGFQELHLPDRRRAMRDGLLCGSCAYAGYVHSYSIAGSNPGSLAIVWNKSRFTIVSSGYYKVSDTQYVKTSTGTTGNKISAKWITWVKLTDKTTGKQFYVLDTHTVASLESHGKPIGSEADRLANYRHHMDVLTSKLAALKSSGLPIFITGDFNVNYRFDAKVHYKDFPYSQLGAIGFYSDWQRLNLAGISQSTGSQGSGNRIIDYVWSNNNASIYPKSASISSNRYGSDHAPVYYTFTLH